MQGRKSALKSTLHWQVKTKFLTEKVNLSKIYTLRRQMHILFWRWYFYIIHMYLFIILELIYQVHFGKIFLQFIANYRYTVKCNHRFYWTVQVLWLQYNLIINDRPNHLLVCSHFKIFKITFKIIIKIKHLK